MTSRQINFALRISAIALFSAAGLALLLGLFLPLQSVDTNPKPQPGSTAGIPGILPPLDSFSAAWDTPLRRPLDDSIASDHVIKPNDSQGGSGSIPLTLVGTIGESLAMLKAPDGSVLIGGAGDEVAGAQIIAVRPNQVDLNYQNQKITLQRASDVDDGDFIKGASPEVAAPN